MLQHITTTPVIRHRAGWFSTIKLSSVYRFSNVLGWNPVVAYYLLIIVAMVLVAR